MENKINPDIKIQFNDFDKLQVKKSVYMIMLIQIQTLRHVSNQMMDLFFIIYLQKKNVIES